MANTTSGSYVFDKNLSIDEIIEDAIEESLSDNIPEAGGPSETNSTGEADEEADGGLLPFLSPVLTLSMIAVAGLVASLRTRKE